MKTYPLHVMVNDQPYVAVMEAARLLGVHWSLVYTRIRFGQFSRIRRHGYSYIPKSEMLAYAKSADKWLKTKGRPATCRELPRRVAVA